MHCYSMSPVNLICPSRKVLSVLYYTTLALLSHVAICSNALFNNVSQFNVSTSNFTKAGREILQKYPTYMASNFIFNRSHTANTRNSTIHHMVCGSNSIKIGCASSFESLLICTVFVHHYQSAFGLQFKLILLHVRDTVEYCNRKII